MEIVIKQGIVQSICQCISINDPKIIAASLEGLCYLLKYGNKFLAEGKNNPIINILIHTNIVDKIKELCQHPTDYVHKRVSFYY